jgi:hypothetical protein
MTCYVRFIGVVDSTEKAHIVEFSRGVNVITGRSSTGKSAMIEIFDFCFGSSDFTVPEGIITQNAKLYFVVLQFDAVALVLARRGGSKAAYIREEPDVSQVPAFATITSAYFRGEHFIPLADFKKELGRYFGLTLTDVEVDNSSEYRGSKTPLPSIRSFTSFMLQHQNLIANKHAIFYRFEEKEKREQAIDHLKVFLGFADQAYYFAAQDLASLKGEISKIDQQLPRKKEERTVAATAIAEALQEYSAASGTRLVSASPEELVENPAKWHELVSTATVRIDALADQYDSQRNELDRQRSGALATLRQLERKLSAARSSVEYAAAYQESANSIRAPHTADVNISECPFCQSKNNFLELEANKLGSAIEWLNTELRQSPYLRDSFAADERKLQRQVDGARNDLRGIQAKIDVLDGQLASLQRRRPVGELAIKAKLKVEAVLEALQRKTLVDLETKKEELQERWRALNSKLKKYQMKEKLQAAESFIEASMKEIGQHFDFESSYQPINLRFSLESFDLWHEEAGGRKIFLRSMGSGANWLYCHLTLFLALHRLFAKLFDKGGKIPPVLFLDQPSQVYFPNFLSDRATTFDANNLSTAVGRESRLDEDLAQVQNVYDQLVRFCKETKRVTGVEPQIIVTDHADHLKVADGSFENLVKARWRTRGFISVEAPSEA